MASGRLDAMPAEVTRHQTKQIAMLVGSVYIAFSSQPISCEAKRSNILVWTVRSWRIVGSGGGRTWNQWHDPKYLKPPGLARKMQYSTKSRIYCLWMETRLG